MYYNVGDKAIYKDLEANSICRAYLKIHKINYIDIDEYLNIKCNNCKSIFEFCHFSSRKFTKIDYREITNVL